MQVQVHHGLPGRDAGIEADVVAVGAELEIERSLDLVDKREDCELFVAGGVEPGRDQTPRNDSVWPFVTGYRSRSAKASELDVTQLVDGTSRNENGSTRPQRHHTGRRHS